MTQAFAITGADVVYNTTTDNVTVTSIEMVLIPIQIAGRYKICTTSGEIAGGLVEQKGVELLVVGVTRFAETSQVVNATAPWVSVRLECSGECWGAEVRLGLRAPGAWNCSELVGGSSLVYGEYQHFGVSSADLSLGVSRGGLYGLCWSPDSGTSFFAFPARVLVFEAAEAEVVQELSEYHVTSGVPFRIWVRGADMSALQSVQYIRVAKAGQCNTVPVQDRVVPHLSFNGSVADMNRSDVIGFDAISPSGMYKFCVSSTAAGPFIEQRGVELRVVGVTGFAKSVQVVIGASTVSLRLACSDVCWGAEVKVGLRAPGALDCAELVGGGEFAYGEDQHSGASPLELSVPVGLYELCWSPDNGTSFVGMPHTLLAVHAGEEEAVSAMSMETVPVGFDYRLLLEGLNVSAVNVGVAKAGQCNSALLRTAVLEHRNGSQSSVALMGSIDTVGEYKICASFAHSPGTFVEQTRVGMSVVEVEGFARTKYVSRTTSGVDMGLQCKGMCGGEGVRVALRPPESSSCSHLLGGVSIAYGSSEHLGESSTAMAVELGTTALYGGLFCDNEGRPRRGSWGTEMGIPYVVTHLCEGQGNATVAAGTVFTVSVDVRNPGADQVSPDVKVASEGPLFRIEETAVSRRGEEVLGVVAGSDPLRVLVLAFSERSMKQSMPLAGLNNTLTLVLVPVVDLAGGSVVTLTGLHPGSILPDGEVDLKVALSVASGGAGATFCAGAGEGAGDVGTWDGQALSLEMRVCE
ncbi:hypothetical protein T484DRAFT_1861909, partial [Baffinella frigidus]